jgi:hypothetical protein
LRAANIAFTTIPLLINCELFLKVLEKDAETSSA